VGRTWIAAAIVLALAGTAEANEKRWGLMVDAGLPDGANGAISFRPMRWFRAHAGGGYNLIGPGVRGGVSFLPLAFVSFNVDLGHYFPGDGNKVLKMFGGDEDTDVPSLRRVAYDYANFHLGLELGGKRAAFYVHGGMSYLWGAVREVNATLMDEGFEGGEIDFREDPRFRVWTVSARMGVVVYLF
jgi:hypothetical protein